MAKEGEIPKHRCGFNLLSDSERYSELDFTQEMLDKGYTQQGGLACCWRKTWKDTGRCIWHARVEDKPLTELKAARTNNPEQLHGAFLAGAELYNNISFRGCQLLFAVFSDGQFFGTEFHNARLSGSDFSNANITGAEFHESNLYLRNFSTLTSLTQTFTMLDLFRQSLTMLDFTTQVFMMLILSMPNFVMHPSTRHSSTMPILLVLILPILRLLKGTSHNQYFMMHSLYVLIVAVQHSLMRFSTILYSQISVLTRKRHFMIQLSLNQWSSMKKIHTSQKNYLKTLIHWKPLSGCIVVSKNYMMRTHFLKKLGSTISVNKKRAGNTNANQNNILVMPFQHFSGT